MENIVITTFSVESEAYQALSEVRKSAIGADYTVAQAMLVRNEDGQFKYLDGFNTELVTRDDTRMGGMLGALLGIAGGPIGMALMGGYGALIGSVVDWGEAAKSASLMEHVLGCVTEGDTVLIALAEERVENAYDRNFEKFRAESARFSAAEVAVEIAEAERIQEEMAREAKKKLREAKKADRKQAVEERRQKIKARFDGIKNRFSK